MSILDIIDKSKMDRGMGIEAPATDVGDVFDAGLDALARTSSITSEKLFTTVETYDRDAKYRELTGRNIYEDAIAASPDPGAAGFQRTLKGDMSPETTKAVDDYLMKIQAQDPEKFKGVLNSMGISETVKGKAKAALEKQAKVNAGATAFGSVVGGLGAGLVAGFTDPINLATIPLGAGLASGIVKAGLIEAGINAGADLVSYPAVKKWHEELGADYGAGDLLENMGMDAIFGAAFGMGGRALKIKLDDRANSAKLAEIRANIQKLKDADAESIKNQVLANPSKIDELEQALRHEERRLHIAETDPSRFNGDTDPTMHQRALEEVDAAINEERVINGERIGMTDEQFKAMDKSKMDPGLKNVARLIESNDVIPAVNAKAPNEILVDRPAAPPTPEIAQERLDVYDSPEYIRAEKEEFDRLFPEDLESDDTLIRGTTESEDIDVKQLREQFKDEDSYIAAISSCGLKVSK